jgi:hypothetical protein
MRKRHGIKRKSDRQRLVEDADQWVKAVVLQRQGEKCLKCNQIKPLHAAHILSKGAHPSLRFELENVIGLCMKDHIFWCHRDPVGFTDWIEERFPGRLARLKEASRHYRKIDLLETICVLKALYKDPPTVVLPVSQDLGAEPF